MILNQIFPNRSAFRRVPCRSWLVYFLLVGLFLSGCRPSTPASRGDQGQHQDYRSPFTFNKGESLLYTVTIKTAGEDKKTGRTAKGQQTILYRFQQHEKDGARLFWKILEARSSEGQKTIHADDLPPEFEFGLFNEDGMLSLTQGQGVNAQLLMEMQFPRLPSTLSNSNPNAEIPFETPEQARSWKMKGKRVYQYLGHENRDGYSCVKYSVRLQAEAVVPEGQKGYANLSAETVAYYSEDIGNYVFSRTLFEMENRVKNSEWDIDTHSVQKQTIELHLAGSGSRIDNRHLEKKPVNLPTALQSGDE